MGGWGGGLRLRATDKTALVHEPSQYLYVSVHLSAKFSKCIHLYTITNTMRLIMLTCNITVLHVNTITSHFDIIILHVNFNLLYVDIGKSLVHITISDVVIIYFAWGGE